MWLTAWERLLGREQGKVRPPLLTAHPASPLSLQEPTLGAERLVEVWGAGAGLTGTSDMLQALRGCLTQSGAGPESFHLYHRSPECLLGYEINFMG